MTPHVLVVDDDALFAESLAAAFELDGRLTVAGRAADGRAAVELARRLEPAVVLMDVKMPVLDGLQATRLIRHAVPSARVVLMSGSSSTVDRRVAGRVGAHAFLPKEVGQLALVEASFAAAEAEALA
jgi:DNA-binding NarL/FixJ family response regulator